MNFTDNASFITLADRSGETINQLTLLWQETFGDEEEFVRDFISCYLIPEYNVPVMIKDGKIVSAFYMIDFELYSKTSNIGNCAYLFAAATKDGYRNKGFMSGLIDYAAELYSNRGYEAIFLFPQNLDLFEFYEKFRFHSIFNCRKKVIEPSTAVNALSENEGFTLEESDISNREIFEDLYFLYAAKTIRNPIAPLKDKQFFFKCAKSYLSGKERFFGLVKNKDKNFCYVFYTISENSIHIDDITLVENAEKTNFNEKNLSSEQLGEYISFAFANKYGAKRKFVFTFGNYTLRGEHTEETAEPLAMMLPLSEKTEKIVRKLEEDCPNYINLFFNY